MPYRQDPIPAIRSAGKQPLGTEDNTAICMQPDKALAGQRAPTPEHIKKYRQSTRQEPGVRLVHHGLRDDLENLDQNRAYGRQSHPSDHVDVVIKAQNICGLADKFNDIKEAKYASHQREPLGRPASRGYAWPQQVQTEKDFRFGVQSKPSESAKDLLFPAQGATPEAPEVAAMYAKTHGNIKEGT